MRHILLPLLLSACTMLSASVREDIVIDDFESGSYAPMWTATGTAFGEAPATGTWPGQTTVTGYQGSHLLNTYIAGDGPIGTLTSEPFTIQRDYINFRLGGGAIPEVHVDLYVDTTRVYRTSPAKQPNDPEQERLHYTHWDVAEYVGQQAYIVVVDSANGGWGHLNVDYFVMSDTIAVAPVPDTNYVARIPRLGDYLQLPVCRIAPCVDVDVYSPDSQTVLTHRLRLAEDRIDFYMPLYVGSISDDSIDLHVAQYMSQFASLDSAYYTDEPAIEPTEEYYREIYHHTPPYGWMNDPNGMVYYNGVYHLFYQYYPYASTWQMMHWGHSTSTDLLHWEYQPVALFPDAYGDMFSGSIVVDSANTAGFGADAFVAIYTSTYPRQAQSIAYSNDEGKTWHKYNDGAPVLVDPTQGDFRDPKVQWYEAEGCWLMSLAVNNNVRFYTSPDLKDWTLRLTWGANYGKHGYPWECPDLLLDVPVEGTGTTKDVLIVSINPGGPFGGSATQYFIGDFTLNGFQVQDRETRWLDYGKDNYAGVTFSRYRDYKDRPCFIGWMSNWQYCGNTPGAPDKADASFRSQNTFPRALSVLNTPNGMVVKSKPVYQLSGLRSDSVYRFSPDTIAPNVKWRTPALDSIAEGAYIVELSLPDVKQGFKLSLLNSHNESVTCTFRRNSSNLSLDRSSAGISSFNNNFRGSHSTILSDAEPVRKITLLVDRNSVELFANNGRACITDLVFPTEPYTTIQLEGESPRRLIVDSLVVTKIGEGTIVPDDDDDPEGVEDYIDAAPATKALLRGQVVIFRGKKRYTLLGTEL